MKDGVRAQALLVNRFRRGRRFLVRCLVLASVVGGACTSDGPTATTGADLSTPEGTIAFHSDPEGDSGLYVMAADGSDFRLLSGTLAGHPFSRWSPDRSQLAFLSASEGMGSLYVVGADGRNEFRVTDGPLGAFDWAPDGRSLVIEGEGGGVWIVEAVKDSNPLQLSDTGFAPRISPDGKSIVYFDGTEETSQIYRMPVDAGAPPTQLTQLGGTNVLAAWSPDGSRIAFISTSDGNSEMYAMGADGSELLRLTNDPAPDEAFQWSPDGSKILYTSYRDGADPLSLGIGNADVFLVDLATQVTRNLTLNDAWDGDPSWSPDGNWIVFTRRTDHGEIFVMHADGSDPQMLEGFASEEANDCCAAWG